MNHAPLNTSTRRPRIIAGAWRTIERIAGSAGAARIIAAKGGTQVYIPATVPADDHWLTACVGRDVAQAIGDAIGASNVIIPSRGVERRHEAIVARYAEGKSVQDIAVELGINERTVRRHKPSAREIARRRARAETKEAERIEA